ncbi:hypothetical protein CEXT_537411 [Caerostris extrusa]|uniref:Peptidase aspartic putative domain-containing protein n=1 Tax=Caerostris extrusa TaxID=172846 RepID=A0AAV4XIR1_CAEEX|nr:hypothetical protein CEXT_537411 [Caerostris extrusa]
MLSLCLKFQNPSHIILLQTCSVIAQSRSKTKSERMLIDSGNEKSFVTIQLASKLKLPIIRKECLTIYAFGRNKGYKMEFYVYQLRIRSEQDLQTLLGIEILATDLMSGAETA